MNTKVVSAVIGLIIIGAVGAVVFWQKEQKDDAQLVQEIQQQQPAGEQAVYTLADIATHNSESDCWSTINGGVYNLTTWIPRHPGGKQAIEGLCGKDGSAAFNAQHGSAPQQAAVLATLKIGTLKQ
jgi:cytochrome b involved in lipid metabolism